MGTDTHEIDINRLLQTMVERKASDLHLTDGSPPAIRLNGQLYPLRTRPLTAHEIQKLAASLLSEEQMSHFGETHEFVASFAWKATNRFRATFFRQKESTACAIRMIASEMKTLGELGFRSSLSGLFASPTGLIVVVGPAGSGRSTTLASMLDLINTQHRQHIVSIEAPIEHLHSHKKALFSQREVGTDTLSFAEALKSVQLQDPDTLYVSKVPDRETMSSLLTFADTGHTVLTTMTTNSAVATLTRILSFFPAEQREFACRQLANCLTAVICQQLVSRDDQKGRVLVTEVLQSNTAIRDFIRDDEIHQISDEMRNAKDKQGIQTRNQSLSDLVGEGAISKETALGLSFDKEDFSNMLAGEVGKKAQTSREPTASQARSNLRR